MRVASNVLVAALVLPTAAWAQVPVGPAFQVNTSTTWVQNYPQVGMSPAGDFIIAWQQNDPDVQSRNPSDVHARRFAADGSPLTGEFRVNAFSTGSQIPQPNGDVAVDAAGDAVVVWSDLGHAGVNAFGRRVSSGGSPLGDDFQINESTTLDAFRPVAAAAPDGRFVVVWEDALLYDVIGRRFDATGASVGSDFRVNSHTTLQQERAAVAMDADGAFTVVWQSYGQDNAGGRGVFGQRFEASGARLGGEFQVNTFTTGNQVNPDIAKAPDGSFVVAWEGLGPGLQSGVWARRYTSSGLPAGEFSLGGPVDESVSLAMDGRGNLAAVYASLTTPERVQLRRFAPGGRPLGPAITVAEVTDYPLPKVASDPAGNLVVVWQDYGADALEVFARRYRLLGPAALALDTVAGGGDGNRVLEPGETVDVRPSWENSWAASQTLAGALTSLTGPPGADYTITDGTGSYATVAGGGLQPCVDCYAVHVSAPASRPSPHWDLAATETVNAGEATGGWTLHVGGSFADVPRGSAFYRFVETLLHRGVTGGCGGGGFCPGAPTARDQMAAFVLVSKEGAGNAPPACTTPVFADVPAASPFCRYVEELARRGVVGGCGGGNYCPSDPVTREQMAIFLLRTLDPALDPPACTTPMFGDVPASSLFCRWVEELARRGITAGCGGGNYCPGQPVTREQMAVFLTTTFGLTLYGP